MRLLGLWGNAAQLTLPAELPPLPATDLDAGALEATAVRHQPELSLARLDAEQAAKGVTQSHLHQWQQAVDAAVDTATNGAPNTTARPGDSALGMTAP